MEGELFSGDEETGKRHWKYATGFPILRQAAPVGKHVFVTSAEPALHCVDVENIGVPEVDAVEDLGNIVAIPSSQIVNAADLVSLSQNSACDGGPDESRNSCNLSSG